MPVGLPPGKPKATMANDVAKPHCLTVDQTGVRYMNEAGSSVEYCRRCLEQNAVPSPSSWMVFDSAVPEASTCWPAPCRVPRPQAWFDEKFLRKADTLHDLAAACG